MELKEKQRSHAIPFLLIALGAAARVALYARNRSVWVDEASLVLNIIHRSFLELCKPLEYTQGAPLGFLMLERLCVTLLGTSEYALRLVPLLASLISLPLFYGIARRILSPIPAAVALALFCFSPTLIYYASEVKQYSVDVAVALLLIRFLFFAREHAGQRIALVPLAIAGMICLWLSHPALFVLAACFLVLLISPSANEDDLSPRPRPTFGALTAMTLCWLASFALVYFVSLRELAKNKMLRTYWIADFPPLPVSVNKINWYFRTLLAMFQNPSGVGLAGLCAVAAIIGLRHFYKQNRFALLALIAPLIVTFAASLLRQYPFRGRLLLFTSPILILLIGAGLEAARASLRPLATVACILLIAYTARGAATAIATPTALGKSAAPDPEYPDLPHREEVRPLMAYLAAHLQPGEPLYTYVEQPAKYYAERFGMKNVDWQNLHPSTSDFEKVDWSSRRDLMDALKGHKRCWILLSHIFSPEGADQIPAHAMLLDTYGHRLQTLTAPGAALFLYDTTGQ